MKSTSASRWGMICTGAEDDDRDMVTVVIGCGRAMHPTLAMYPRFDQTHTWDQRWHGTAQVPLQSTAWEKERGKGERGYRKFCGGPTLAPSKTSLLNNQSCSVKKCGECCYRTVRTLYSVFPARRILFSKASRSCFSSWAAGKAHQEKGP